MIFGLLLDALFLTPLLSKVLDPTSIPVAPDTWAVDFEFLWPPWAIYLNSPGIGPYIMEEIPSNIEVFFFFPSGGQNSGLL